jgi:hypothetical protein
VMGNEMVDEKLYYVIVNYNEYGKKGLIFFSGN